MEQLEICFSGPLLPASILLLMTIAYCLLVIAGAVGLDTFDLDLDADGVGEMEGALSLGFVGLKFLNIGRIPLIIWIGVFSLALWTATAIGYTPSENETLKQNSLLLLRSAGIALVVTKILTQPFVKMFQAHEPIRGSELVGRPCVITTLEATETVGQARVQILGAAPLVLNVRSVDGKFGKGDEAQIKRFDANKNIYYVGKFKLEV